MPLTEFQATVLALLAPHRSDISYLAGGAALHIGAAGERYSNDLDFFHSTADAASAADAFIGANTQREPGVLLQDRRTGSFFLPQSDDDWSHTREHRGALGGVVAQPADTSIAWLRWGQLGVRHMGSDPLFRQQTLSHQHMPHSFCTADMQQFSMRYAPTAVVRVLAACVMAVSTGACGGGVVAPVLPPNAYAASLPVQAASFNPFVGSYAATGRLPDGRAVRYELSIAGYGTFTLRYATDAGAGGYTGRFGVATGQIISQDGVVPLPDGTFIVMNTFLPKYNAGTVGVAIGKLSSAATNDYVSFTRLSAAVQGNFGYARVVDPSADCNATNAPAAFQRLLTKYLIPGAKAGNLYVEGELTAVASSTHGFNFFLNDLNRTDPIEKVSVGEKVNFPNAKAQLNYFERSSDGKIRQWSAVSGAVVFDAVEKFGVDVSIGGDIFKSGSAVTFHLENVRMQAQADNPQDLRFAGARGSFTLSYSGTSTEALQMISR